MLFVDILNLLSRHRIEEKYIVKKSKKKVAKKKITEPTGFGDEKAQSEEDSITNRDATASWSGYIYQSILGLIVSIEIINSKLEKNESIDKLHLIFEKLEDFSIREEISQNEWQTVEAHQVKNLKSTTRSDYFPAIRLINAGRVDNPDVEFFLHTSVALDLTNVKFHGETAAVDYSSLKYRHSNGENFLAGGNSMSLLNEVVNTLFGRIGVDQVQSKIDLVVSELMRIVDSRIIETKSRRDAGDTDFIYPISFVEINELATNISETIVDEMAVPILKSKLTDAYLIHSDTLEGDEFSRLESFHSFIVSLTEDKFREFVRRVTPHKKSLRLQDFIVSLGELENIQDVLFNTVAKVIKPICQDEINYEANGDSYRPTVLKASNIAEVAQKNYEKKYIPNIISNMQDEDIEGYFLIKNLIINGETIDDIWEFRLSEAHLEEDDESRTGNKITEPLLKRLVETNTAIGEINED